MDKLLLEITQDMVGAKLSHDCSTPNLLYIVLPDGRDCYIEFSSSNKDQKPADKASSLVKGIQAAFDVILSGPGECIRFAPEMGALSFPLPPD